MELNVWKFGRCRRRYYLTHPLKWLRDVSLSVKWTYQRATRGYADIDWYELHYWMISVLSSMFDEYAEHHYGYPGEEAGFTDGQWTTYLRAIAAHMRNASEDQQIQKNEYEADFKRISEVRSAGMHRYVDEKGFVHHEFPPVTDKQKETIEKYFARLKEIDDWRLNEAQTALKMIGDQFFSLWD